jgi:Tol biopolymer transport system component
VERLREPPYATPTPELWLADNRIIFSRAADEGTGLWQVRLDRSTMELAGEPERISPDVPFDVHPAVAPNGRFVSARLAQTLNIWMVPLDPGRGRPAGPLSRVTEGAVVDSAPFVTPDGKKIAFISNRLGRSEVWLHDFETGRQVVLTESDAFKVFPVLDRTASRLAYAQIEDGRYVIYVMSPGGGTPRRVCDDCGQPRGWMPGTERILYQRGSPGGFWTVDTASGATAPVLKYDFGVFSPRFSFDERWLVFHARIHPDATRVLIAPYLAALLRRRRNGSR